MLAALARHPGAVSSAGIAASGIGIALDPKRAAQALAITPTSSRGVAEIRAGIGGTFAALGLWALLRGTPDAYTAVGVTWLGAAAVRTLAIRVDEPQKDVTYWGYLAAELTLGVAGLMARGRG
jgi:hypothetical protein